MSLKGAAGAFATPFTVIHSRPARRPYILKGGIAEFLAWFELIALWYTTARNWIDLITDAVDLAQGHYCL